MFLVITALIISLLMDCFGRFKYLMLSADYHLVDYHLVDYHLVDYHSADHHL